MSFDILKSKKIIYIINALLIAGIVICLAISATKYVSSGNDADKIVQYKGFELTIPKDLSYEFDEYGILIKDSKKKWTTRTMIFYDPENYIFGNKDILHLMFKNDDINVSKPEFYYINNKEYITLELNNIKTDGHSLLSVLSLQKPYISETEIYNDFGTQDYKATKRVMDILSNAQFNEELNKEASYMVLDYSGFFETNDE